MIDENTELVHTVDESVELNSVRFPCIIISASGMASGSRVLHNLKTLPPNPRNSIVFTAFQAPGTRRDALVNGAKSVKIHGEYWPVKAEVYNRDSLSAHGDYNEILTRLKQGALNPGKVYVTHGEVVVSDVMRKRIREQFGSDSEVTDLFAEVTV